MMPRGTAVLAAIAMVAVVQMPGRAQFGFGGSANSETKLVDRYDKDGDGRLNRQERAEARRAASSNARGVPRGRFGGGGAPGPRLAPADVRPYPTTPFYDLGTLRTIFIDFENDDWEDELAAFYNTDVEVPATVTIDGKVFEEAGIHFRGQSSYRMVGEGRKRSLNVSLDFVHDGADFDSYQTFNLLNANNDPTFLRTVLYTEIARQYAPIPKANFVRVVINGESWGIYVNVQQFNNDFARDFFKDRGGQRWKAPGSPRGRAGLEYLGEDPAPYKQIYEIKTKDDPESWQALIQMTKVLNETPPAKLEAALDPLLDIDGALRFLATEVALVNSDGYWSRASDYNLYRDTRGRFHIVPHDVNEGLGGAGGRGFGGGFGGRNGPTLDPLVAVDDPGKPLHARLLGVPALRERYLRYVRQIAEKSMDWDTLLPAVQKMHALIAADVRSDTRKLYDTAGFEAAIAASGNPLRSFLDARREFLLEYTAPQ